MSLRASAEGADTPSSIFGRLQRELEPLPFLGDVMHRAVLKRLAAAPRPALTRFETWHDPIRLTDFGRALLDGGADRVAANGIDRWLGGLHLHGATARWRWDGDAERPVWA